jgi:hypothetical protein
MLIPQLSDDIIPAAVLRESVNSEPAKKKPRIQVSPPCPDTETLDRPGRLLRDVSLAILAISKLNPPTCKSYRGLMVEAAE